MKRTLAIGAASLALCVGIAAPAATASAHRSDRPSTYALTGDPVVGTSGGSKFEGIGLDAHTGAFYVSEITGGEIHRGQVRRADTRQWLDGDGTDGRHTARGVTVDDAGRVYIAGGPNAIEHAGSAGGLPFEVSGRCEVREVEIAVRDFGAWRDPREGDQGRGLSLIRALMDTVDVEPRPEGTTVRLRRVLGEPGGHGGPE